MTNYQTYPRRGGNLLPTLVAGAAFTLAVFLVFDRTGWLDAKPSAEPRAVTPRGELAPLELSFVEVFERCSPSVAHINTSSLVRTGWGGVSRQNGSGSGFVWDAAGIVVTNHHVVENAREVQVTVAGKNYRADVLASSPVNDLAVLQLRGRIEGLEPLLLGSSDDLRVGQTVIAIGNPFGFDQTMTTGIVSALNRTIQTGKDRKKRRMSGLIQVDAAINPGNSGGPVLDSAGRLIGVATAIYSPSGTNAGIGFAVPVDKVNEVVPQLLGNQPDTAVLGVRTEYDNLRLDPSTGYSSGAIITDVVEGYGAEAAGIRPFRVRETRSGSVIESYGDVIVALDDQPVRSFSELPRTLKKRKPGDKVRVRLIRGLPDDPQEIEVVVKLSRLGKPSDM
ncbi:MAG: trypsin-like peptidase domain-containing protein [bacterium]|nr:trypsin-like peptidase domain-containing protein [bacterium]